MPFVCKPHCWKRGQVKLPSHDVIPDVGPSFNHSAARYWAATAPLRDVSQDKSCQRSQTDDNPRKDVEPKYLFTALLPYNSRRNCARKPCPAEGETPIITNPCEVTWVSDLVRCQKTASSMDFYVAESARSITVAVDNKQETIPARFWLVLDNSAIRPTTPSEQSSGLVLNTSVPVCLTPACGGGAVVCEEDSRLLKLVDPKRLNLKAADFNFRRASNATSHLVLRHAWRVIELVAEVENRNADQSGYKVRQTVFDKLPVVEKRHEEISTKERFQRAARTVNILAKAEKKRTVKRSRGRKATCGSPKTLVMISKGALAMERGNSSRVMLQKGVFALEEFLQFVNRQFGNPVRGWFHLDPEESMKLGEKQFMRIVADIGFRGNIHALWRYMDSDGSGSTTLLELDVQSAIVLAVFKKFIYEFFGCDVEAMFRCIDTKRSGKVSNVDFVATIERLGYTGPSVRLFDLLDRRGHGYLIRRDFNFIAKWKPQQYLWCKPDQAAHDKFMDALLISYGEPLFRVWRKVLDRDGSMRISWDEFRYACNNLLRAPVGMPDAIPKTEVEMAGIWRALDKDCSGWISLRDFDPVAYQALGSFRLWSQRRHGGVMPLFRSLDDNGNGKVSLTELMAIKKEQDGYTGNVEVVFVCLDVNHERLLTEHDVNFLDSWDVWWEEFEMGLKKTGNAHDKLCLA